MGRKRVNVREKASASAAKQWKAKEKTSTECGPNDILPNSFSLAIHHQGEFRSSPSKEYVGGRVDYIDNCNAEKWSLQVLDECAVRLGYPKDARFGWYGRIPGMPLETGLYFCMCDWDCDLLVNTLPLNRVAEVYLQVGTDDNPVRFQTQKTEYVDMPEGHKTSAKQDTKDKETSEMDSDIAILEEVDFNDMDNRRKNVADDNSNEVATNSHENFDSKSPNLQQEEDNKRDNAGKEAQMATDNDIQADETDVQADNNVQANDDMQADDKFDDPDYTGQVEEDVLFDEALKIGQQFGVHKGAPEVGPSTSKDRRKKRASREGEAVDEVNICDEPDMVNVEDMQSEYETDCSRELKSESESEDEDGRKRNKKPKFSVFNEKTEMRSPRFKVGQRFSSVVIFRLAVRIQAIMEGRDVQFIKNDTYRVRVKCRGCEWQIFGSKMQGENTFQIKTLSKEHTCGRVFHNRNMTSKLATRLFVDEVRKTPSMTVQELMTRVTEELNVDFSLKQGYRTMKKVRDIIEGSHEKQYALLEDFCGELRRANPGSTVFVETDEDEDGIVRFKRLYMCLEPLKRGFLKGCRHWIGLDGCFLKDTYGGQLLTAVGMDGDNKMFPLALSVVRVENYDNWSWFLGLLVQDLEISDSSNWCVMTDKQKGLVQTVRDKMPQAEHRCCVQHLYTNFKQIHRGLALKERLWKCAKASYVTHWKVEMEQLGQESAAAHSWLDEKDPKTWCRAHFRCGLDCDILVNNMCESFNAVILKARSLPIISMLQTIYLYLLKRMERNREAMSKHEGLLCPAIFEILEKAKQEQCMCIASYAGTMKYQISCPFGEQYIVDMAAKTCSCRKWQLRGIPCGHAVAAINRRHEAPEKHVSNTYLKITYLQSYEPVLNPINGPNLWEHIDLPAMKPPTYRRFAGRPKKMRKKASEEDRRDSCVNPTKPHKVSKVGTMMSCSRCKKYGHNKRGCPDKNKQTTEGTTTSSAKENSDIGDTGPSMQPSTNEACPSDVTVDILGVSTQQSHTGPSQNLDANQPKQGAQEPVTKKGRKCSFCRKHGHSKNSCKLRQWTFRSSLDMTGDLGFKTVKIRSDDLENPYNHAQNSSGHVEKSPTTTHLSSKADGRKLYSHSHGVTMRAPHSYVDLGTASHSSSGLKPAQFTWQGNLCVNLSTLQTAAGHAKESLGIENVQLHGDGNQSVKLGKLQQ